MTTLIIYTLLAIGLVISLIKDRAKTKQAIQAGMKAFLRSAPSLVSLLFIVALTFGFLPPDTIENLLGERAGFWATILGAVIGALTLIPSLVAFPLSGSLLESGATVGTIAAFITTLVMVGVVTAPMEALALGKKFTILRNSLSFMAALIIAAIMGMIL